MHWHVPPIESATFALASALDLYAVNLIDQGEVARAAPVATESLALFRMRGNRYGIGNGLGTLGRLALLQGDLTATVFLLLVAIPSMIGNLSRAFWLLFKDGTAQRHDTRALQTARIADTD